MTFTVIGAAALKLRISRLIKGAHAGHFKACAWRVRGVHGTFSKKTCVCVCVCETCEAHLLLKGSLCQESTLTCSQWRVLLLQELH